MIKFIGKILRIDIAELPFIFRDIVYILILSIFIGFIINIFHPKGFVLIKASKEKEKNIVLISSEEAKIKKDCGSAVLVDSRPENEFTISHLPGAINIPAIPSSMALTKIQENFQLLSSDKELILYCDGLSCGSSQILAKLLMEMGYLKHIYIIKNGIPEWERKGYPVEKQDIDDV